MVVSKNKFAVLTAVCIVLCAVIIGFARRIPKTVKNKDNCEEVSVAETETFDE